MPLRRGTVSRLDRLSIAGVAWIRIKVCGDADFECAAPKSKSRVRRLRLDIGHERLEIEDTQEETQSPAKAKTSADA